MHEEFDDKYLINGVAVFWCSPEPGEGCGADRFTQAWLEFDRLTHSNPNPADAIARISDSAGEVVAQLVAASVCGEPTCFADELADLDREFLEQIPHSPSPDKQVKHQPAGQMKFSNKPQSSPKKLREWLCARGTIKNPKHCVGGS